MVIPVEVYATPCKQSVTLLEEGASAPCRGFLFSPEKANEATRLSEDLKFANEALGIKDQQIELLKRDVKDVESIVDKERKIGDLWRVTAEENTLKLIHANESQGKKDALIFGGGFLAAMLAVWAAGQLR